MTPPPWAAEVAGIVDPGAWSLGLFGQWALATVDGVAWRVGNDEAWVQTEDFEASLNHDGDVPRALRALRRAMDAVNTDPAQTDCTTESRPGDSGASEGSEATEAAGGGS